MLNKNECYKAQITGYTNEGMGVARIENFVVFVKNAILGEICDIKIIKVNKNISYGIIEKVIEKSKDRVEPECMVSKACGGCSLWHMNYDSELEFKREKVENTLKRIGNVGIGVEKITASDDVTRYRNKAQFPVCDKDGHAIFGFYRSNSHEIIECDNCLIQTENSNKIAKKIVDFLNENKIYAYNEQKHTGFVRNIFIRTGIDEIFVCIVSKSFDIPKIDMLVKDLCEQFPKISGIVINKNSEKTNQILGKKYKCVFGKEYLTDILCENTFEIAPDSFYQVNRKSAEKLYQKAIEFADFNENDTALDMYCGAGTITLAIAKNVKKVIGIEIVESAVKNARNNAKINNIHNAEFIVSDAKIAVKTFENEKIDVIMVDPPRKGLDQDTISSIIKINPEKIVYVSCDPATLARDIKLFSGYKVEKAQAFDLFPRTWHVESVVLMLKI